MDSRNVSRVSRYSGASLLASTFGYGSVTLYGVAFQRLGLVSTHLIGSPTTPGASSRFGLIRFRSPLLTESRFLYTPPLTEMFHFSGYCVLFPIQSFDLLRKRRHGMSHARLSYSEISGSTCICHSPKLIAAYRVLHRLLAPRHPLYALMSFCNLFYL